MKVKMRNWTLADVDKSHKHHIGKQKVVTYSTAVQEALRSYAVNGGLFEEEPDGTLTACCVGCGEKVEVDISWFTCKRDVLMFDAYCGGSPRCLP